MPYFSILTSSPLKTSATEDLTKKASRFAAELLGKPEAYVMAVVSPRTAMTFAGSDTPAAFVELKSVGLPEAQCNNFADKISTFVRTELGIDAGRVFIDFTDLPRSRFAWNGKTFG